LVSSTNISSGNRHASSPGGYTLRYARNVRLHCEPSKGIDTLESIRQELKWGTNKGSQTLSEMRLRGDQHRQVGQMRLSREGYALADTAARRRGGLESLHRSPLRGSAQGVARRCRRHTPDVGLLRKLAVGLGGPVTSADGYIKTPPTLARTHARTHAHVWIYVYYVIKLRMMSLASCSCRDRCANDAPENRSCCSQYCADGLCGQPW
jgi:hypothetical protein